MNAFQSISAVAAICLLPTAALAQQATEREMLKQYCTGDYLAHCSEFTPDTPEVEACFRNKAKLISANCTATIAFYQQKQGGIRKVSAAR